MSAKKMAIITGASGELARLVEGFLNEGYKVVTTDRKDRRQESRPTRSALGSSEWLINCPVLLEKVAAGFHRVFCEQPRQNTHASPTPALDSKCRQGTQDL
jgi:hypothetical protein